MPLKEKQTICVILPIYALLQILSTLFIDPVTVIWDDNLLF